MQRLKKAKIQQALKFDRKRVELIEKLKTKQKQLDATLKNKSSDNCYERVEREKHFEKLVRKQAYNHDHLEYESVKTASAFNNNSSQWIVQKKAEGSRVRYRIKGITINEQLKCVFLYTKWEDNEQKFLHFHVHLRM